MSQAARKTSHAASNNFKAALRSIESVQKAEHEALDMGKGQIEQAMQAATAAQHALMESACICCDNIGVLTEAARKGIHTWTEMGNILWGSTSGLFARFMSDAEKASACQSITDAWELQNMALKQTAETCISTTNALSSVLLDCYRHTLEPLSERSLAATKQWKKILA